MPYKIDLGSVVTASLTPVKTVRLPKDCRTVPSNELFLRQLSQVLSMENCTDKCRPPINFGRRLDEIPICGPNQSTTCMNEFYPKFLKTTRRLGKPCTSIEYSGTSQVHSGGTKNAGSLIYRFMAPPEVEVHEEYLIQDALGLTGSIGGTLGICVGASIYDFLKFCLKHIIQKLIRFNRQRKRKSRKRHGKKSGR